MNSLKISLSSGIDNKEIQDHLLGEIKETDNSQSEPCMRPEKYESKLAQRKLLSIVAPSAVSVEVNQKKGKISYSLLQTANFVDALMIKANALPMEKHVIHAVVRTTLNPNVRLGQEGPVIVDLSLSQGMTQGGQIGPMEKNRCSQRCNVHEIEECHDESSMEDLNEQVQCLFYS